MSTDKPNVVIVGGGIIGCCTAYYLSREGVKVTLLERGVICSEASSAAAGLATISTREGLLLALAQEGVRLLFLAQEELEADFGLVRRGGMAVVRTEEELVQQRALVEKQRTRGLDVRLVDRESVLEMEPSVSPEILGGVYSPLDSTLSPYATTLAFGRAARRQGADLRQGVEVTALKVEGGRVRAAVTRDGEVAGDLVVVAAGAWSPLLTRTIGLDLPIEPSRGQLLVSEPLPPLLGSTIRDTGHFYIVPTGRGNYVMGSVTEKVGFDKRLTPDKLSHYAHEAEMLVPALKGVRAMRAWAGLRPLSPDNLPFLGPVDGYDGLILATGHSRLGILFSAVTSKMVADGITKGTADFSFEPFRVGRFAGKQ